MKDYDPSDLTSTLVYIKNEFGLNVFTKQGRAAALVSDLAPRLKNDRIMLERLSRLGILEDFVSNTSADEEVKRRLIYKFMSGLKYSEYIRADIVDTYLSTLVTVFEWDVEVQIQNESSTNNIRFDSERYMQESQDETFLKGKKAFGDGKFDEAKQSFCKAYERGNVLAGVFLGEIYFLGNGCDYNYEKAISMFVDGMNRGCPLGAEWLAYAYKLGNGVPQDREKARELLDSSIDALEFMAASGSTEAQYFYGLDLLYDNFSNQNKEKGIYWLEKAMNAGLVAAGIEIAKTKLYGWGCRKDEKAGIQLLVKYVNAKNKDAHYELGRIYYYGIYNDQDYKKALSLLLFAAEQGHSASQHLVGNMYYWGKGVEKDYGEARKWYELAQKRGNRSSSEALGFIYFYGLGVLKDLDKAFEFYKFAADNGLACSQYMLHYFYFGSGKYKDYETGKEYLEKSAKQDHVLAQKVLAFIYIANYGFNDENMFIYWMKRAADQNDVEAQNILEETYYLLDNAEDFQKSYSEAINLVNKLTHQGDIQTQIFLLPFIIKERCF